jgi:hypothetical protein
MWQANAVKIGLAQHGDDESAKVALEMQESLVQAAADNLL